MALPPPAREHFERGYAFYEAGDLRRAIEEYDFALALCPDVPDVLNNRGVARDELGNHEGAISDFTEALRLRPDFPWAVNNRGVARGGLADYAGAVAEFAQALRLRPRYPEALYNRSIALKKLDRYEDALASVNEALALWPDDADAQALHRELLDKRLHELAELGVVSWSGGKPRGSKRPVRVTPGPPISDYIVEEREHLRGPDRT